MTSHNQSSSASLLHAIQVPLLTSFLGPHQAFQLVPVYPHAQSYQVTSHSPTRFYSCIPVGIPPPSHLVSSLAACAPYFCPWGWQNLLWGGTGVFGGPRSHVLTKLLLCNTRVFLSSPLISSLVRQQQNKNFTVVSELMMESNMELGIAVTLQELLMLHVVCVCFLCVEAGLLPTIVSLSADIVILISRSAHPLSLLHAPLQPSLSLLF